MKTLRKAILGVGILGLATTSAQAGWEGKFTTQVIQDGKAPHEVRGTMRMEGDRTRVDLDGKMDMSVIFDVETRKAWVLMHSPKVVMESDGSQVPGAQQLCGSTDVDACLKEKGFRKTGSETLDGVACSIYEGRIKDPKNGEQTELKIWRPDSMKEVPAIRVVGKSGATRFENRVSGVKTGAQPASHFSPPKNYRSMGNPMELLKRGMPDGR